MMQPWKNWLKYLISICCTHFQKAQQPSRMPSKVTAILPLPKKEFSGSKLVQQVFNVTRYSGAHL